MLKLIGKKILIILRPKVVFLNLCFTSIYFGSTHEAAHEMLVLVHSLAMKAQRGLHQFTDSPEPLLLTLTDCLPKSLFTVSRKIKI